MRDGCSSCFRQVWYVYICRRSINMVVYYVQLFPLESSRKMGTSTIRSVALYCTSKTSDATSSICNRVYAAPITTYNNRKDIQAPAKRPAERQKIMMVPANEASCVSTNAGPNIMLRFANKPFVKPRSAVRSIVTPSLRVTIGSCECAMLLMQRNAGINRRTNEVIHTDFGVTQG